VYFADAKNIDLIILPMISSWKTPVSKAEIIKLIMQVSGQITDAIPLEYGRVAIKRTKRKTELVSNMATKSLTVVSFTLSVEESINKFCCLSYSSFAIKLFLKCYLFKNEKEFLNATENARSTGSN
jgi:hypothetical protein